MVPVSSAPDDIENDRKFIKKKFIRDLLREEDSSPVIVDEDSDMENKS